jgi:hypothetical protein
LAGNHLSAGTRIRRYIDGQNACTHLGSPLRHTFDQEACQHRPRLLLQRRPSLSHVHTHLRAARIWVQGLRKCARSGMLLITPAWSGRTLAVTTPRCKELDKGGLALANSGVKGSLLRKIEDIGGAGTAHEGGDGRKESKLHCGGEGGRKGWSGTGCLSTPEADGVSRATSRLLTRRYTVPSSPYSSRLTG